MTQTPMQTAPPPGVRPHRGTLVLVLGILSLLCNCAFIPGILAWVLGSGDLKAMARGEMDRSGEGTTRAGMIMGIISIGIAAIGWIVYIIGIIAGAGWTWWQQTP